MDVVFYTNKLLSKWPMLVWSLGKYTKVNHHVEAQTSMIDYIHYLDCLPLTWEWLQEAKSSNPLHFQGASFGPITWPISGAPFLYSSSRPPPTMRPGPGGISRNQANVNCLEQRFFNLIVDRGWDISYFPICIVDDLDNNDYGLTCITEIPVKVADFTQMIIHYRKR